MHLLHIIGSMDPVSGGPAQGIRILNSEMEGMGVIREVVCLDAPDAAYLGMDGFKIHAIGPAKGAWCYSPSLKNWLAANVFKFDVVIINGLWLYPSFTSWRVINNFRKKNPQKKSPRLLVMAHGMLDPYFQRSKERRLKAIRNWLYWKLIENKVINGADGLLFTCHTELLLARQTFSPYHPKKEYNVGYGIMPPQPYYPKMSSAFNEVCPGLGNAPYLLFLSRIHPKKGTDLLIKAYIDLHKSMISAGRLIPKLVIAGPGLDTPFGKMMMQLLDEVPDVGKDVFFPGMLTGDAKWGAFYNCEAFVLPSHQENFGIAVVEALACGKPVLITNQINIWREIENEGAGIIENDDITGVQNMLKQWMDLSMAEKTKMNERAIIAYQNQFTVNKFAKNFFTAFTDHD